MDRLEELLERPENSFLAVETGFETDDPCTALSDSGYLKDKYVILDYDTASAPENIDCRGAYTVSADPSELTEKGIEISRALKRVQGEPTVYFADSTAMIQYRSQKDVFKFYHTLKGRLRNAGAKGVVLSQSGDDKWFARLKSISDGYVEF